MRKHVRKLVVTAFCIAAPCALLGADDAGKQEAIRKELKRLEGTWLLVSAERNGQEAPKEALTDSRLVMQGDKFTIHQAGGTFEGTIGLDPTRKPKAYDARATRDGRKVSTLGIYEIDDDTLRICYTPEGGQRPKEFATKGGTDEHPIVLGVYKKEKAK
jgi:uncharacterized protein (TIGR03067 family)